MKCRNCGRENPPYAKSCGYCGRALANNNIKNRQNETEKGLVALIIVLLLVLVIGAGVLMVNRYRPPGKGFRGGGGGGGMVSTGITPPTPMPLPTMGSGSGSVSTATPALPTPTSTTSVTTPSPSDDTGSYEAAMAKKEEYLYRIELIKEYEETHFETAGSQYELNVESQILYEKWDDLLNEVYQYLKSIMTPAEFESLQEDEIIWIKQKEDAIKRTGEEWAGGSGEGMARNITAIEFTESRCYYLIDLIDYFA